MARAICAAQGLDWKDQFSIYSSNGDPLAHEAYMHDADAALSALRQWLADEGLVCVPLDFIAGPNAWLASWAQHVGNCKGGYKCECGLVAARHDLARAMIAAAPDALETKP
jgi:hypothetical protein